MINSRLSKPFTVLVRWTVFKNECKRIFSSCVSLFSYQGPCLATAILDYHIFSGLSRTFFIFLKISFFKIFQFFSTALIDYHKPFCLSRTFFKFFNLKTVSGERGIWTLARREPSTPLAGAPLQPLEYFSIAWIMLNHSIFCSAWAICIIPLFMKICQLLF